MKAESLQATLRLAAPLLVAPQETARTELPPKRNAFYRLLHHPLAMPYNRLALLMVLLNLAVLSRLGLSSLSTATISQLVLGNFTLAIGIRSQYVINLLFAVATSVPKSWPLSLRWAAGKVYHFGGIHVGAFLSGSLWFALLSWKITTDANVAMPPGLAPLTWIHLFILVTMMIVALPPLRARYHNTFEITARFGNWTSLVLFWIQAIAFSRIANGGEFALSLFASQPQTWLLALVTTVIALPWLRLRKVPVKLVRPSSHVVLAQFDYGVTPFAGSSTDLSRNPLLEWHSFANVPAPGKDGFRLTISRAGDWTGRLIDERPDHIWVKGIPTAGVGNIEKLFKKVIWVATGSGIGPCLPHLLANKVASRLVWSTRNPERTYGTDLLNEILAVQPDAVIWDTDANGKPDLVQLAYKALQEFDAEAVICIANKKVTWYVVEEFESRGIPAFGAIWDS